MPTETSIGLSQATRDRLDDYRTDAHASMEEVLEGLMEMVPTAEEVLEEGCAWSECDKNLYDPPRPEDKGGVIQWFHHEYDGNDVYGAAYFCSPEHAAAHQEELNEMAATEPDCLIIGGMDEMRMTVEMPGLRLFHEATAGEGRGKEIGIPAPMDLVGEDRHGNAYDYHGEPIYVENAGKVRFSGIIDDIFREEAHTAIYMGRDRSVEMAHHPNERQEWLEGYCHWYEQPCPECESTLHVSEEMGDEVECSECGETVPREAVDEGAIPEPVRKWRAKQDNDET